MHIWDRSNRETVYTIELIYMGLPGCPKATIDKLGQILYPRMKTFWGRWSIKQFLSYSILKIYTY